MAPDALGLVLGADEELVDPDGIPLAVEGDVAGRVAFDVGDEDGFPLEHRERAPVGAAVETGEPEEQRLVVRTIGPDVCFPVRHQDCAIARSTASCSSGESATGALPRSSCFT